MTKATLVSSLKGGVGKTTISANLARSFAENRGEITVVDADIDSSNFASVIGIDEKGTVTEDHDIIPPEKDGIKVYSVETMFDDTAVSLREGMERRVAERLVHAALDTNPEHLVIDCPPGASAVFRELIDVLSEAGVPRAMVLITQPNAISDLERMVTINNNLLLPIAGFVENMSGTTVDADFKPFGKGEAKQFVEKVNGNFYGQIPLTTPSNRNNVTRNVTDQIYEHVTTGNPFMDEDTHVSESMWSNILRGIDLGRKLLSNEIPVNDLRDQFGFDVDLTLEIQVTDLDKTVYFGIRDGAIKPIKNPDPNRIAGGVALPLRELRDGLRFEREMMHSPTGELVKKDYSLTKSVKLGFAEIYQRDVDIGVDVDPWDMLMLLEYILREEVGEEKVKEIASEAGASTI